jgi:hypothetical protein
VRPGTPLNAASLAAYRAMGISHIVVDPPVAGASLEGFRENMEQVAELAGLRPRA